MAAPTGPKKVHRYTVEFKIQAVRLSLHPEIQTQDVAQALDIHPFMLSKWKKDYRDGRLANRLCCRINPAASAQSAPPGPGEASAQATSEAIGGESAGAHAGTRARAQAGGS